MRTIFKLSSSVSVPNPIGSPLNKTSYFNGGFIHNYALITNLNDSASSDTMTLARASSKTFIPDSGTLTTVTSNNPAFTGSGILIEPSHTNKLTYSSQLDNAAWTKEGAGTSVTANAGTAPDGTTTADQINAGTSGSSNIQQVLTVTGSSTCGFGAFVKAGSVNYVTLRTFDTGLVYGTTYLHVNLTNGVIEASSGNVNYIVEDEGVIDCGSGWYYIYQTVSGVDRNTLMILYPANSTTPFNNANGNNILAWNLQGFEDAVGNLSPVETTTAAATSLKDDLSMPCDQIPANDFYIEFDWTPLSTAANGDYLLSFTSGSGGNEIFVGAGGNRIESNGGASVTSFTPSVGTTYTIRLTRTSTGGETLSIVGVGSDNEPTATADITWPATGTIGSRYSGGNHSHSVISPVRVGDA